MPIGFITRYGYVKLLCIIFYNIYIAMKKNGNDIIDARKRNGICDIKPYLLQAQYWDKSIPFNRDLASVTVNNLVHWCKYNYTFYGKSFAIYCDAKKYPLQAQFFLNFLQDAKNVIENG